MEPRHFQSNGRMEDRLAAGKALLRLKAKGERKQARQYQLSGLVTKCIVV
jgi:hypothetical protein